MKAQNTGSASTRQVSYVPAKPETTNQASQQVFPASGYVFGRRSQADIDFDERVGRDWRDN